MEKENVIINEIKAKNKVIDDAIAQLKKEFVGIHAQIDEIMDNVRTWYLYPKLQSRPLTICLFGMSGIGKTSLVKRISQLLNIEKDMVYFNFASINESSSWEIENQIEEELSNESSNRMFVYDEFQYAATINPKTGEERDNKTGLKPFWELLDSGLLHKRSDFWNVRMPYKVLDYMAKINMKHPMVIRDGVWVNANECLSEFRSYDIHQFSEVFNFEFDHKKKHNGGDVHSSVPESLDNSYHDDESIAEEGAHKEMPFFIKEGYLDKILQLHENAMGKICDKLETYHKLEEMDCDEIMEFVAEVYDNARKGYDLKFNDSIIFVIANLDEAYQMSFDVNPDMSPDQFRKITEKISVVDIKDALKKRFRNEQIARLGNIQVIYPSFSSKNFEDIIQLSLDEYATEAKKLTGYTLLFDDTIKKIIYDEGVFPTHGTRPLFSTVHEIVKSKFPEVIRHIYEEEKNDEVSALLYTFDNDTNEVVIICQDKEGNEVTRCALRVKLRLKQLRQTDENDDEQALCALHESGHFVMYAKLFHKIPEKLVSRTTETNAGGFLMEDIDDVKKKVSRRDMMNELSVLLGGYVAEKEVFGGDEMSMGASGDLFKATQLASKMVRRFGMGTFSYVATNVEGEPGDENGLLINEDNQSQINLEIKNILKEAENNVRHTFLNNEWRNMLKESATYLCENSAMSKEKMAEIYDKVSESTKGTAKRADFYRNAVMNM